MLGVGPPEMIVILALIVLLFGASKVPELARSMGKAKGEFKKGLVEGEEEEEKAVEEAEKDKKPPE